ncbi:hypothetical protein [Rhizobium sp. OAE497]|uniref:hypothetical protein n=1 Tax=Rhizobium sp. OAE497 TaxID=2663796 RepID=UPI003396CFE5
MGEDHLDPLPEGIADTRLRQGPAEAPELVEIVALVAIGGQAAHRHRRHRADLAALVVQEAAIRAVQEEIMGGDDDARIALRQRVEDRGRQNLVPAMDMHDGFVGGFGEQPGERLIGPLVEMPVEDIGDRGPVAQRLFAERNGTHIKPVFLQPGPVVADEEGAVDPGIDACLQALDRNLGGATPDNGHVIDDNQAHV